MEPEAYEELHRLEAGHWWYRGMRGIIETLIRREVSHGRSDLLILDAGCGAGGNLDALSAFGRTAGFDYSPLALGDTNRARVEKLARASVEAVPYASNTFDLVTSFDVIYAAEVGDDQAALREFARVTRPGGYVLVRVPALRALRGPHDDVVHGVRRYTAVEMRVRLEQAGLRVRRMTYANSLLLPLIYSLRKAQDIAVALGAAHQSDTNETAEPANTLLTGVLGLEARWIGRGHHFPLGVSLISLAQKPES